ncbi:MAG: hypothetical protein JWQ15_2018, partial [Marmoricola sp.]|nr:hypothetical protein [Marmoricola sp.]
MSAALNHSSNDCECNDPCLIVIGLETEVLRWFQHVADGATVTEVAETEMVS